MGLHSNKKIAIRYASALADLDLDNSIIDELYQVSLIFQESDIFSFFQSPKFSIENKIASLNKTLEGVTRSSVLKTLQLIISKNRISIIPLLSDSYADIYYNRKGILNVSITSPKELSDPDINLVKNKLQTLYPNNSLNIKQINIDSSLLTGLKINIGDQVLDYSLKASLKQIEQSLLSS